MPERLSSSGESLVAMMETADLWQGYDLAHGGRLDGARFRRVLPQSTLVEFYVNERNTKMPHPAFGGQTPDEMFFGTGSNMPENLALAKNNARAARLAANRAMSCERCLGQQAQPPEGALSP